MAKVVVDDDPFALSEYEAIKVKVLNDIRDQIVYDILTKKHRIYAGVGIEPTDEFEEGVSAAIGLIEHRVHSICDV